MKSALPVATFVLVFAASAAADPLFIEGHVGNLRTGLPLRAAVVSLTDPLAVPAGFPAEIVGKSAATDDSGFFSIELSDEELDRGWVEISATCETTTGAGGASMILDFVATLAAGLFAGAAGYVSIVPVG